MSTTPRLVLASTSFIRRRVLEGAGLDFDCEAPGVDESACDLSSPDRRALFLAEAKAQAVSARRPADLIIGSDQVFELEGVLHDKPEDAETLRRQLRAMSGRSHRFHCGLALVQGGRLLKSAVDGALVAFHPLTEAEIDFQVRLGEGLGCAGGYRLEERGVRMIRSIEGSHFTVLGLPLLMLLDWLRGLDRLPCELPPRGPS